jgi:hypothetical protein
MRARECVCVLMITKYISMYLSYFHLRNVFYNHLFQHHFNDVSVQYLHLYFKYPQKMKLISATCIQKPRKLSACDRFCLVFIILPRERKIANSRQIFHLLLCETFLRKYVSKLMLYNNYKTLNCKIHYKMTEGTGSDNWNHGKFIQN